MAAVPIGASSKSWVRAQRAGGRRGNEGPAERDGDGKLRLPFERDDERVAVVRRLQQQLLDKAPVRAPRNRRLDVELDRLR